MSKTKPLPRIRGRNIIVNILELRMFGLSINKYGIIITELHLFLTFCFGFAKTFHKKSKINPLLGLSERMNIVVVSKESMLSSRI
jgi:hypothetical protein